MPRISLRLVNIADCPAEWEKRYLYMAVELNGRTFAQEALDEWQRKHREDYKKIRKVAKLIGEYRPILNQDLVKPDSAGSGVYEMRAHKGAALFCL